MQELFHYLSLHKTAMVIAIITSQLYQHYTAILSHLCAAKYTACSLWQYSVAQCLK